MDYKLTPEQAIEILKQDFVDYSPISKFVKPISRSRANEIADLIQSQQQENKLLRAAANKVIDAARGVNRDGHIDTFDSATDDAICALEKVLEDKKP